MTGKTLLTAAFVLFALLTHFATPLALAIGPKSSRSIAEVAQKTKAKPETVKAQREVETQALTLVQAHLPELKGVLERLRSSDLQQYNRAIVDLARSARKLDLAKNRDERLFEIEVENLKAENAVNLLTAKLKVRDREAERKLLRKAVSRLHRAQLTRAQYDVEALRQRLERNQQQLNNAQQRLKSKQVSREQQLQKAYVGFLRKAGRQVEPGTSPSKSRSAEQSKPGDKKN